MNESEFDISSLEYSFGDPMVNEIIQEAHLVNEYLAESNPSEDDAIDIASELNTRWGKLGIRNQNTLVTGHGWIVSSGDTDDDGNLILREESRMHFSDQDAVLHDFVMHEATDLTPEGVTTHRRVYLYGKTLIEDAEDGDNVSYEDCVVDITPETTIRYEGVTSNRAQQWLRLYYPEEQDSIMERCVNADSEGEALLNFGDYSFDTTGMREEAIEELSRYLEVFIDESVGLERQIPYIVTFSGCVELFSGGERGFYELDVAEDHKSEFMYFYDIHTEYDEVSQTIQPWVQGSVVSHDGERVITCRVPVAHLKTVTSIRSFME